uniref:Uncharacterized protein LOC103452768 isoform X1 n=1 Tax=Rhizophora mucronata TaxID=61149 RepID=A0A2P2KQ71_RHIMU
MSNTDSEGDHQKTAKVCIGARSGCARVKSPNSRRKHQLQHNQYKSNVGAQAIYDLETTEHLR